MTPIRAVIVDDESLARDALRESLAEDSEVDLVGEYENGSQFLAALQDLQPDLAFLDVQMPRMSGFEIIEEIRTTSVKPPFIVLVTAFERYAVRAFQEEAVDYLVKPVEPARVASTVARVREYMAKTVCHEAQETWITRVAVKEPGRVQVMNMEDADWLEAAGNYVRLHMGRTSYMYRTTMNNLETRIDPRRFVRIHRTTIVNVDRISELHTSFGREHIVVLRDGTRLRLSAAYRARLAQMVAGL